MNNKRTVVFVLGYMRRGGAERVISILSRHYAEKGWDTVICLLLGNGVDYELDPKTRIIDFSGRIKSRLLRLPYWLFSMRNLIKAEHPDVVVSFAARINIIVQIACLGLKSKVVVSERNDPLSDGRGIVTRMMTAILYPQADCVVFQTDRVKKLFSKRIQAKAVVVPNPIDVSVMATETTPQKIVSVGSLKPQKNHDLLIRAFSQVLEKYPEAKLYIYGDGPLRCTLQSRINGLGISQNVFLEGEKSNVHEEIKDAALFVLSSDYEGLSNALLEAMMIGLPCISTNCAGSDEYITNNKNGMLVPVGDIDALSSSMMELLCCEKKRLELGKHAKEVADRVSTSVALELWDIIIEGR